METSYIVPVNLSLVSSTDWTFTGIYKITNVVTGMCYIGQALDIRHRLMQHANNKHDRKLVIYKAIDKYGINLFDARILTVINTFNKTSDEIKKELNFLECFYIELYDSYKHGYNMTPGGDSGRLGFKHTKETIEKIKKAHKNYKPKAAFDISKKTYAYNIFTNLIIEADSMVDSAHKTGADVRSIGQICRNSNYKNGGRFIANKKWLFANSKEQLMQKVDWYFSGEYEKEIHKRRCKHWEERRKFKNG